MATDLVVMELKEPENFYRVYRVIRGVRAEGAVINRLATSAQGSHFSASDVKCGSVVCPSGCRYYKRYQ